MKNFSKKMISIEDFFELNSDGVYYCGHASIIARICCRNYLFDYVEDSLPYGDRWRFFPKLVENIPLDKIDGIFVSHLHQDHFDPLFLGSNDVQCPVYVIGGRSSFESALHHHGIKHVSIPAGVKTEIAPNVYVYGLLHPTNGIDASCCIGNQNFSVYHGNNNYLPNESLASIDSEFTYIDIACIPYAYINWYPQLLDNLSINEKQSESERLCKFYFEYAIEQADYLKAAQIIPFGANLVYKDSARSPLNLECKTPLDFESYIHKNRGVYQAARFKALFSGDVIVKNMGSLDIHSADLYDEETYRDKMQEFLAGMVHKPIFNEEKNERFHPTILPITNIKNPTRFEHFICVSLAGSKEGVMINTKTSKAEKLDFGYINHQKIDFHHFTVKNPEIYSKWIHGDLRFEEVIGSREFSLLRNPNIYNKEVLFIATTQI